MGVADGAQHDQGVPSRIWSGLNNSRSGHEMHTNPIRVQIAMSMADSGEGLFRSLRAQ